MTNPLIFEVRKAVECGITQESKQKKIRYVLREELRYNF
jgi:hypothetical protein